MIDPYDPADRVELRYFEPGDDPDELGRLALEAWSEYAQYYKDWSSIRPSVANMSALANTGDIMLCVDAGVLVGAVAYLPPFSPRDVFFDDAWALIRMLIVAPDQRGKGIGRYLTQACIERARQTEVSTIGLHTSPMMRDALALYLRLGFEYVREAPSETIFPYAVYTLKLN